jgi:phage terminase large subunit-like protein
MNELIKAQQIKKSTAELLRRIKLAREDLAAFILYVWSTDPNLELADFHHEAIKVYTDSSEQFVYWEAARGHGKSTITSAFVTWMLGRDTNHKIKIICANDKEARKRLREIKEQITKNNLLKLCFPKLRKLKDSVWNKSQIIVDREIQTKDPSIEALGITSGALGSRSTIIVLDDIVDLRNSILQPQLREQIRVKVFGEVIPTLEPGGILRAVGTCWTLVDCNALMKESKGFRFIGPHAVGDEDDPYKPIWSYKFTRDGLIKLKEILGAAEYARAYKCLALTGDTVPIQGRWIKFYNSKLLGDPNELYCLQAYDLAIEQSRKNDYFAHVSALWDKKRNYVFFADAKHERISFNNQAKTVVENASDWRPQDIIIEKGGYQGALHSHLSEIKVAGKTISLPIYPFHTRGRSKERRLMEVQPFFEEGKVFFNPKFDPRTNPSINETAPIVDELTSFPFGKFDDLVDAISMILLTILELDPDAINRNKNDETEDDEAGIRLMII